MIEITVSNFRQKVLNHNGIIVVDFLAPWCAPCKIIKPILEEYENYNRDIKFVSLNIDEAQDLSIEYKITAIPSLAFFRNGKIIKKHIGIINNQQLQDITNEIQDKEME